VSALPATASRASVEEELDAARGWARRHDWTLDWNPETLILRAATYHRPPRRLVEVVADAAGYRAVPPAWRFVTPGSDEPDQASFPAPGPNSIFHPNFVICAPWNRLAYSEHGGPHPDWSGPAAWLQVRGVTTAHSIPDMLATLNIHLRQSPGFMR
jgi:hypothetical protein